MSELDDPNTVTVTMEDDGYLSMCRCFLVLLYRSDPGCGVRKPLGLDKQKFSA